MIYAGGGAKRKLTRSELKEPENHHWSLRTKRWRYIRYNNGAEELYDHDMDPSVWHYDRFWAAEIHKLHGKYYLMVNCSNESKEYKHGLGPCVAVSESLLGTTRSSPKTNLFTRVTT